MKTESHDSDENQKTTITVIQKMAIFIHLMWKKKKISFSLMQWENLYYLIWLS